jgi:L-lactate utilization protein LutB
LDKRIEDAVRNLEKHGFKAEYVADAETAQRKILERIPKGAKVGIPGSKTIRQLGLDRALTERGNVVFDHWRPGLTDEEVLKIRKAQLGCDVLLSSANAITETGELYNMDGVGNRIAPMIFGPELVIIAAGVNKLVPDLNAARERLQKIAAPRRAAELKLKLNCTVKGECGDCNSQGRICRAELVLHRQPMLIEYEIFIIGEELGN